jgi:hypothetical protein
MKNVLLLKYWEQHSKHGEWYSHCILKLTKPWHPQPSHVLYQHIFPYSDPWDTTDLAKLQGHLKKLASVKPRFLQRTPHARIHAHHINLCPSRRHILLKTSDGFTNLLKTALYQRILQERHKNGISITVPFYCTVARYKTCGKRKIWNFVMLSMLSVRTGESVQPAAIHLTHLVFVQCAARAPKGRLQKYAITEFTFPTLVTTKHNTVNLHSLLHIYLVDTVPHS